MPIDKKDQPTEDSNFDEFLRRLSQDSEEESPDIKKASDASGVKDSSSNESLLDRLTKAEPADPIDAPEKDDSDFDAFLKNLTSNSTETLEQDSFQFDDRLNSLSGDPDGTFPGLKSEAIEEKLQQPDSGATEPVADDLLDRFSAVNDAASTETPMPDVSADMTGETSKPEKSDNDDAPSLNNLVEEESDPWESAESRLSDLQQNFQVDIAKIETKQQKPSLIKVINSDDATANPVIRTIYIVLGLVILGLIGVIGYFLFVPVQKPTETKAPLTIPISIPYPVSLDLFAEKIDLQIGQSTDNQWEPVTAEWLKDSEVCRLIALPDDLKPTEISDQTWVGSTIELTMSNGDLLSYSIKEVKPATWEAFIEYSKNSTPSMAIAYMTDTLPEVLVIYAELIE